MAKKTADSHITPQLRALAVPVASIRPDPANARLHTDESQAAIMASLRAFGQRKPVIVNKRTNRCEAGSGTLMAARALGWPTVAAVFVDDDPSTATGFALADNRVAELSGWNPEALAKALDKVKAGMDEDLDRVYADLEQLFQADPAFRPNLNPEASAPSVSEDDIVKAGQKIQDGLVARPALRPVTCPHCAQEFHIDAG